MIAPTKNPITQAEHGIFHAVDYSARPDPTIYAPEDATVVSYANSGACGNNLQMEGKTGRHGFCHLESASVKVGDKVKQGQPLGKMGYTGLTIPTGPNGRHLHWVLYRNGEYVYPVNLVREDMPLLNKGDVINIYRLTDGKDPVPEEIKAYEGQPWEKIFYEQIKPKVENINATLKYFQNEPAQKKIDKIKEIIE